MKKKLLLVFSLMGAAMLSQAQTKIGGAAGAANTNAFLQLGDANASRGLLLSRVALTSTTSFAPLSAHVEGMHVYNTATAGAGNTAVTPGEYYNDGTQWIRVATSAPAMSITGNGAPNAANAPNPVRGMIYTDIDGGDPNAVPVVPASSTYGQQWTYSGAAWVVSTAPNSTEWNFVGTANDAGNNKNGVIYRSANIGIGNAILSANATSSSYVTANGNLELYRDLSLGAPNGFIDFKGTANHDFDGRFTYDVNGGTFVFGSTAAGRASVVADGDIAANSFFLRGNTIHNNGGEISSNDNSHFNVTNGRTTNAIIAMPQYGIAFPAGAGGGAETWISGSNAIGLFSGGGERVHVNGNNGFVGIGTTNPQSMLDVNGLVTSRGFACRTGIIGAATTNSFNISWSQPAWAAHLWMDNTDLGQIVITSDRRLKENIQTLDNSGITLVNKLRPVSFTRKNIEGTIFHSNGSTEVGFIADELQSVIPSAVNGDKDALTSEGTIQPQSLNLAPVVSVLTKAIQEQQAQIEDLKKQVAELKAGK